MDPSIQDFFGSRICVLKRQGQKIGRLAAHQIGADPPADPLLTIGFNIFEIILKLVCQCGRDRPLFQRRRLPIGGAPQAGAADRSGFE